VRVELRGEKISRGIGAEALSKFMLGASSHPTVEEIFGEGFIAAIGAAAAEVQKLAEDCEQLYHRTALELAVAKIRELAK